jgi:hypothetical protein
LVRLFFFAFVCLKLDGMELSATTVVVLYCIVGSCSVRYVSSNTEATSCNATRAAFCRSVGA